MQIAADTDLGLAISTAEPASRPQQALNLFVGRAGTPDQLTGEHPATDDARRPSNGPIRRSGRDLRRQLNNREAPSRGP